MKPNSYLGFSLCMVYFMLANDRLNQLLDDWTKVSADAVKWEFAFISIVTPICVLVCIPKFRKRIVREKLLWVIDNLILPIVTIDTMVLYRVVFPIRHR